MAEGKKSFVAYADWKDTFDALPDDKAGQLIKHIFAYVSDENPESDDYIIDAVFANIKNTLKRDLKKWEKQQTQRVEAGKKSAEIRKQKSTTVERPLNSVDEMTRKSTVSVNDSVSVNVNDTVIKQKVFMFKNSLIDLGIEKQITEDWLKVRKTKKASNTETAFNDIKSQIEKSNLSANECIKKAVEQSWSGFKAEWLNATQQKGMNHPFVMSDEKKDYDKF